MLKDVEGKTEFQDAAMKSFDKSMKELMEAATDRVETMEEGTHLTPLEKAAMQATISYGLIRMSVALSNHSKPKEKNDNEKVTA